MNRSVVRLVVVATILLTAPTSAMAVSSRVAPAANVGPRAHSCEHRDPVGAWKRATHWAKRHAPKEFALLRPGATAAQIAHLRKALPMHVPSNLVKWLQVNDGARSGSNLFPYDRYPLSVHGIIKNYRDEIDTNTKHYTIWQPNWIPVLGDRYGNNEVLRAGHGKNSRCIFYFDPEFEPAGDFEHHGLATMFHALGNWERAGETRDHWPLVVRHGRMHWQLPKHKRSQ